MHKRWFVAFVAVLGLFLAPLDAGAVSPSGYEPLTSIQSYRVQMKLGRDDEKRSTLDVVETLTYKFPTFDLKHGATRDFVKEYDGHSLSFKLKSVTNEKGKPLSYHWSDNSLRIGDADKFMHGENTYIISYSMRDVTRYYEDNDRDEFFWDMVGLELSDPLSNVSVEVEMSPELAEARVGQAYCYFGEIGATNQCPNLEGRDGGTALATSFDYLGTNKGVTMAVGFKPGTFTAYQATFFEKLVAIWKWVQAISLFAALLILVVLGIKRFRATGRRSELRPIVTEFIPPSNASVSVSANIGSPYGLIRGSVPTAQLIDLAVRHFIKIIEVSPKKGLKAAEYKIEVIRDPASLKDEERELLEDMIGGEAKLGSRVELKTLRNNRSFARRLLDNDTKLQNSTDNSYGMRELNSEFKNQFRGHSNIILIFALLTLSPALLVCGLIVRAFSTTLSLTDKGLALRRYLMGLREYIKLAEVDRLKLFQSPEGAEKLQIDGGSVDNPEYLVKLYERVLPYAILFGLEKQWNKQLGDIYAQSATSPDWYSGTSAFNTATFVRSFNNSVSATGYTPPSSSSSFGGSTGGGFSGGGGGGGGVGSW